MTAEKLIDDLERHAALAVKNADEAEVWERESDKRKWTAADTLYGRAAAMIRALSPQPDRAKADEDVTDAMVDAANSVFEAAHDPESAETLRRAIAAAIGASDYDLVLKCTEAQHRADALAEQLATLSARAEAAEARAETARAALEFYAAPWDCTDEQGEPVRVPDFYSELDFEGVAIAALAKLKEAKVDEPAEDQGIA